MTGSFCPHSVALGSTHPLNRHEYQGKVRLGHGADSSAVLVVLNSKVWMEVQHSSSLCRKPTHAHS